MEELKQHWVKHTLLVLMLIVNMLMAWRIDSHLSTMATNTTKAAGDVTQVKDYVTKTPPLTLFVKLLDEQFTDKLAPVSAINRIVSPFLRRHDKDGG
jgi:hypothetical protein